MLQVEVFRVPDISYSLKHGGLYLVPSALAETVAPKDFVIGGNPLGLGVDEHSVVIEYGQLVV